MTEINFNGVKGKVIESSPHGNYLVVKLTNRITICGTFSNMWHWEISEDQSSGFKSFMTYIGFNTDNVCRRLIKEIKQTEMGYFKDESELKRPRKRVQGKQFKYEMKIRGLSPDDVSNLMNFK